MAKLTADQKGFLTAQSFGHIATLNKDGSPQVSPVWVDVDGDTVIVNSEEKRLKIQNVKRDPRVSLSIQDPANPYRYLEIRGKVTDIRKEGAFEHIDKMAKKYMGQDKYPYNQPDDVRVLLTIEPKRIVQPMG
ncbi:MAG TPA: PPOX class F420-dependent oxidoreductase [Dehalococcoidia bacterium]